MPLPPELSARATGTRLEALDAWLAGEDPDATPWLLTFLEGMLRTGDPKESCALASRAVRGQRVDLPGELKGAAGLHTQPYAWRDSVAWAIRAAGRRAAGDRRLVGALFRALLLWPTHERELAIEALLQASPSPEERAAGLDGMLVDLPRIEVRAGERVLTALEVGLDDPGWLLSLVQALDRHAAAIEALSALPYAILPRPAPLPARAGEAVQALRARLDEGPPVARAIVALALGRWEGAVPDAPLVAVLAATDLPTWVVHELVVLLLYRGARGAAVAERARALLAQQRYLSLADELRLLELSAAPPAPRPDLRADGLVVCATPEILGGPAEASGRAWALVRRVVRRFPAREWRASEEEVSLISVGEAGDIHEHPLPVRCPGRPTGAAGAERDWDLVARLGSWLLISERVPFSDDRGWGTENHVLAWDLEAGRWCALQREGAGVRAEPLDAPVHEDTLPSWGYGELLLWVDEARTLRRFNDGTPYHLEDSEPDAETRRAQQAVRESARGWTPLSAGKGGRRGELRLEVEGAMMRLAALETTLKAQPEAGELILLGAVRVDGGLAVAVRDLGRRPYAWRDQIALVRWP